MTSDGKAGATSPPFPDWFPKPIAAWIKSNRNHSDIVARQKPINGVAANLVMKRLWEELRKQHPAGDYVNPAQPAAVRAAHGCLPSDLNECQGVALIFLFKELVRIVEELPHIKVWTNSESNQHVNYLRQRAAGLRVEADDTDLLATITTSYDWPTAAAGMRAKADVLEQAAAGISGDGMRFVVPNARPNPRGLATAIRIAAVLESLFGKPFHVQAARIATALTGENTTKEQVRQAMRMQTPRVKFTSKSAKSSHS